MAVPGGVDYIRPWVEYKMAPSPLPAWAAGLGGDIGSLQTAIRNALTGNVGSYYDSGLDYAKRLQDMMSQSVDNWNLPQTWSEVNAAHPGYEAEVDQRYNALMSKMDPYIQAIGNQTRGSGGGESGASSGALSQQLIASLAPLNQWASGQADAPAAQMRQAVGAGNTSILNYMRQAIAALAPQAAQGYAQSALAGPMGMAQNYMGAMQFQPIVTQGQNVGMGTNFLPTVGGTTPMGGGGGSKTDGEKVPGSGGGGGGGGTAAAGRQSTDAAALAQQFANPYDWVTAAGGGGWGTAPADSQPGQYMDSPWGPGDPYAPAVG